MEDAEETPLINHSDGNNVPTDPGGGTKQRIGLRYYIIAPIMILACLSYGLDSYTSTQWIQHYIKVDMFKDAENDSAIGACTATNHSDPNYITYTKVQASSAEWQFIKTAVGCIPAIFVSMILPSYSDSLGRRFLFIVGFTGSLIQMVLQSITVYFELELYCFVSASFIAGLSGGIYIIISACSSYIADITKNSTRRAIIFTAFDGLLLTGVTISALLTGYVITYSGYYVPFALGGAMMLLALLLTIFCLPESHDKKNRLETVNICQTLGRTFGFYRSSAFKGRRMVYILLLSAFFFQEIVTSQRTHLEMLYQLGMPLCWTAQKLGTFTALRHAAQAVSSILFIVPLKACLSDLTIAIFCTLFNAGSYVLEGFATTYIAMYLVAVPSMFGFLTLPMIKSIMSLMTPPEKQGSLFASVTAVQSMCGIVGMFVMNSTYAATVSIMNGFVFLMLAGVCIGVFLLLCLFGLKQKTVVQAEPLEKSIDVQRPTNVL